MRKFWKRIPSVQHVQEESCTKVPYNHIFAEDGIGYARHARQSEVGIQNNFDNRLGWVKEVEGVVDNLARPRRWEPVEKRAYACRMRHEEQQLYQNREALDGQGSGKPRHEPHFCVNRPSDPPQSSDTLRTTRREEASLFLLPPNKWKCSL
eukprot:1682902-Pyramimonas_sp.AAC.1